MSTCVFVCICECKYLCVHVYVHVPINVCNEYFPLYAFSLVHLLDE